MLFNDLYINFTTKEFKATKEYLDKDIEEAISFYQGDSILGFPTVDAFLYLIQQQLQKIKEPALSCLENVFNFLENLINKLVKKNFARFQDPLIRKMNEIAN